jgi:endonuclease/exonuclease/phosphatase (EEP) superfamily protein YafD
MSEQIILCLTLFIAILTALGFSNKAWWFVIVDFFRLQYAVVTMLLCVAALIFGHFYIAVFAIIISAINLYRIRNFFPHMPHKPEQSENKDVFSVNAFRDNEKPEKLAKLIEKADPELLLIMEMTERLDRHLVDALKPYTHRLQTKVRDGFSICLLSKKPFLKKSVTYHGPGDTPLLYALTTIHGQDYHVYSAHPKPALNKSWFEERQIYFNEISQHINNEDHSKSVIVLGDFNSVPWESHFVSFLNKNGLKSTVRDQGYKVTWPVYFPLMGIPMDHILISENETYSRVEVGPYAGSDHFPVSINLR